MSEYIKRGALIAFLDANHNENDWMVNQYNADWICSWIDSQPAADVVEVKHGRWIPFKSEHAGDIQYCSACDIGCPWQPNYCPNCGADMRGVTDG